MDELLISAVCWANHYDVIVAGGGPAGVASAIAAARQGLKTLLIERSGCLGGVSTSGALPFWLGAMTGSIPFRKMLEKGISYRDLPRARPAVGGIFVEAMNRIKEAGGGVGPAKLAQTDKYPGLDRLGCHDEFTFDIEIGKRVLDEMVIGAGVEILYHTLVTGTKVDGRVVSGVYIANKDGMTYVKGKAFIDCTGDADLVAQSGFDTYKGDRLTAEMTEVNLVAHIENIESRAIEQYLNKGGDPWFCDICRKAKNDRLEMDIPGNLILFPMMQEGVFMINEGTTFSGYDGTNAKDITRIMLIGRQRARVLVEELFQPYMPGSKNCRLRMTAAYPGIRETRRIVAEYMLSESDLIEGKRFDDTIALGGRHFDLGRGGSQSRQPFHDRNLSVKTGITPIPYRAMIPRDTINIIVAGRSIAADGQALGPARVMSTCFAMGEAAGIASALYLKNSGSYRGINPSTLKQMLRDNGALVDY